MVSPRRRKAVERWLTIIEPFLHSNGWVAKFSSITAQIIDFYVSIRRTLYPQRDTHALVSLTARTLARATDDGAESSQCVVILTVLCLRLNQAHHPGSLLTVLGSSSTSQRDLECLRTASRCSDAGETIPRCEFGSRRARISC
jgi:hypothetical protein